MYGLRTRFWCVFSEKKSWKKLASTFCHITWIISVDAKREGKCNNTKCKITNIRKFLIKRIRVIKQFWEGKMVFYVLKTQSSFLTRTYFNLFPPPSRNFSSKIFTNLSNLFELFKQSMLFTGWSKSLVQLSPGTSRVTFVQI